MMNLNEIITEEFESMLNEIGESNVEPYQYIITSNPNLILYKFTTEDNDIYQVTIRRDVRIGDMLSIWLVEFGISSEANQDVRDFKQVVNKGKVYKVMTTVSKIVKEFAEKYNPDIVVFIPSKKNEDDYRRFTLYKKFIEKNITSDYEVNDYSVENIIFIVNKNIFNKSEEELRKINKVIKYNRDRATGTNDYESLNYMLRLLKGHVIHTYGGSRK